MPITDLGALVDLTAAYGAAGVVQIPVPRTVPAGNVLIAHSMTSATMPAANTYTVQDSTGSNPWQFNGGSSSSLGLISLGFHSHRCRVVTPIPAGGWIRLWAAGPPYLTRHVIWEISGANYPAAGGNSVGPLVGYNTTSYQFTPTTVPAGSFVIGWFQAAYTLAGSSWPPLAMSIGGGVTSRGGPSYHFNFPLSSSGEDLQIFTGMLGSSPALIGPSASWAVAPNTHLQGAWGYLTPIVPPTAAVSALSSDRLSDRRKVLAYITGGALQVDRYNDAFPEAVASSQQLLASGSTDVSLRTRRSGIVDLVSADSGQVRLRTSRDGGRTWSMPITIDAGSACTHVVWESRGLLIVAYWLSGTGTWHYKVGTLGEDGSTWAWSAAQTLVGSGTGVGELSLDRSGILRFTYVTAAGAIAVLTCRKLAASGAGTWS